MIVTGDFNTGEDGQPCAALFEARDGQPSPVRDTFRVAPPERTDDEGTFSNFDTDQLEGDRIDWVGASTDCQVVGAEIHRTTKAERTPSDHLAVTAVLRTER